MDEMKPVHFAGGKNGSGLSDNKPSLLDLDRGNTIGMCSVILKFQVFR